MIYLHLSSVGCVGIILFAFPEDCGEALTFLFLSKLAVLHHANQRRPPLGKHALPTNLQTLNMTGSFSSSSTLYSY